MALLDNLYRATAPSSCCLGLEVLKWAVCGLNYQAQFILINQIQAVLGNRVQVGL